MTHEPSWPIELAAPQPAATKRGRFSRVVLAGPRWFWSRTKEAGGLENIRESGKLIRDLNAVLRQVRQGHPASMPRPARASTLRRRHAATG